jgi:hypothetical protein
MAPISKLILLQFVVARLMTSESMSKLIKTRIYIVYCSFMPTNGEVQTEDMTYLLICTTINNSQVMLKDASRMSGRLDTCMKHLPF